MPTYTETLVAEILDARPPTVREYSATRRRAYNAEAARQSRAKKKALKEAGVAEAYEADIQAALADAAIVLLAAGGSGAAAVREVLEDIYRHKVGIAFTIEHEAISGSRKPKLYKAPPVARE